MSAASMAPSLLKIASDPKITGQLLNAANTLGKNDTIGDLTNAASMVGDSAVAKQLGNKGLDLGKTPEAGIAANALGKLANSKVVGDFASTLSDGNDPNDVLSSLKDVAGSDDAKNALGSLQTIAGTDAAQQFKKSAVDFGKSDEMKGLLNTGLAAAADPEVQTALGNIVSAVDPDDPEAKAAAAAAEDKKMCNDFRQTFEKNQAKYNEAILESLTNFFQNETTIENLNKLLSDAFARYVTSSKFNGVTATVVDKALNQVIQKGIKKAFRNGANLKGVYKELGIYMQKYAKGPVTVGGTRSKRKSRRKTVKRRK